MIRLPENFFPYLENKGPNLGTLILSGATMWLPNFFSHVFLESALLRDHFALLFVPIQRLSKVENSQNFF
jgi:hypothetical protein